MESGRVHLAFLFFIIFPLFWAIYRHDIFFQEDLWEVSVKLFMKCLNILPAPLRFIQEPVPQNPRGVFSSLWNEFSTIVQTSFLKKPVPQKPQGVFISLWRRISEVLPIFLKSLKDVTSFSKEQLTSSFQILCENNVLNLFLVICIILAVFTWILKMKIFIETLLAFKEFREERSCWNQTYNHHALMNLRQRVQTCRRKQQIVKPCRCSCRRGELHKQQNNKGTRNYTANTPSLGLSKLCNNLDESYCHQSGKRLNKRVLLISPHKSVKHSYQGNDRAITKGGKGNENFQSQVKDLLKNAYSKFNRQVALVNTVSPVMDYHVTNNSCGTRMNKSVSPGSANTSEVGAVQASHKGLVMGKDLQKQHKSATTTQVNNRGHKTRKNLQKTQSGKNTLTTQYIDGDLCSEVGIPVFHLQEESRYTSKAKEDSDLSRTSSLNHQGESCGMMLKTSPITSARYYDVVFHFGLERNGVKSNFLVDPAKKEAVITIQAGYRGYLVRNDLKRKQQSATTIQANYRGYKTRKNLQNTQSRNNTSTTQYIDGDFCSEVRIPVFHLQEESRNTSKAKEDSDLSRARSLNDQGESCGMMLKTSPITSARYYDVVFHFGLERNGVKSNFLVDPAKKEAVVTIQAGYRGYLVRNDLKRKHQSATTIQTNYRGYRVRKHLKNRHDVNDIVNFQAKPAAKEVNSSRSSPRSDQGQFSRLSSRSPGLSPKYDQDSSLEHQRRVQMGKVIRPRLGHDGGTTSCDTRLKSIKKPSPLCDVAVSSHGYERNRMKSHVQVDAAKEEAVVVIQAGYRGYLVRYDLKKKHQSATTIQTNYRGYRTRNHLKKTHNEDIVTFQGNSSPSGSRSYQGPSSKPSSRSPASSPKYDQDSALEHQDRVQMGKVIRPRLGHDGGTGSCDVSLKSMKNRTPRCDVVVSSHGHEKRGVKNNFLIHPSKEEAVVIIQAGYRGYLVRNDLKKKHQSATTIQTNSHGHRTRNHLKKTHNENKIVTFQVNSSQSSSRNYQGHSSGPSSRSPGLSPEYDRDSALKNYSRVQKVIQRMRNVVRH